MVGGEILVIVHHVGDEAHLGRSDESHALLGESVHAIGPCAMKQCLLEQAEVLVGQLLFTAEDGATRQILELLHTPSELHAALHAETVAIVGHAVVVVDEGANAVDGTDVEGGVTLLAAIPIMTHLIALTPQVGQGQITHQNDGTSRIGLLQSRFLLRLQEDHQGLPQDHSD